MLISRHYPFADRWHLKKANVCITTCKCMYSKCNITTCPHHQNCCRDGQQLYVPFYAYHHNLILFLRTDTMNKKTILSLVSDENLNVHEDSFEFIHMQYRKCSDKMQLSLVRQLLYSWLSEYAGNGEHRCVYHNV